MNHGFYDLEPITITLQGNSFPTRFLREQAVACDQRFDSLTQEQKHGMAALYAAYPEVLSTWKLTNLENYISTK